MAFLTPSHSGSQSRVVLETYQAYVRARCVRNPSLTNLHHFLTVPGNQRCVCRITALDYRKDWHTPSVRNGIGVCDLERELENITGDDTPAEPLQGRILFVEDLDRDTVELLGYHLNIDPLFFSLHLHSAQRRDKRHPTSDETTLPSRLKSQNYINLVYHRSVLASADPVPQGRFVRSTNIERKVIFLPSSGIGLAQHSASVLKTRCRSGQWLALILVDPPMSDQYIESNRSETDTSKVNFRVSPFLGSYEEFSKTEMSNFTKAKCDDDEQNNGIADDLISYFTANHPPDFDAIDPSLESLAYYPLRIVAAEWVKYTSVMDKFYMQNEERNNTSSALEDFNQRLRHLQSWRRRAMRSNQKLSAVLTRLREWDAASSQSRPALRDLIMDYQFIHDNVQDYGRKFESMIPMVTSLVSILDARHSFAKTSDIGRLTVLALIFVPLNYISSLFSMNPVNAPGSAYFWVYFVVAIPITLLVAAVARPPTQYILSGCFRLRKKASDWRQGLQRRQNHERSHGDSCIEG